MGAMVSSRAGGGTSSSAEGPGAGVPVGGTVGGASSARVPAEAPVGGVKPVVTLRGTVVMQGQVAEAQRQAAMAMMDAAQAQRAGARGAIARAAAEVGASGEARRSSGRSRAVAVALAAVLLVGVLAATWIIGREKRPAAPAGVDGGSCPRAAAGRPWRGERIPKDRVSSASRVSYRGGRQA
ncbi:hypothetical protein [Sorangium sp. So ce1389]|uniref:hypothetical protein n=1 Tax=Sorangium sp. So ce1389 TaxID=3133336 RepID=UPI003F5E141B